MNHLKIIQASQGPIRKYEDLKRKLYQSVVFELTTWYHWYPVL